jgi:hypothetical protein
MIKFIVVVQHGSITHVKEFVNTCSESWRSKPSQMSNGTSKKTYSCFICEKNGYPDERVYLAGKDENGKTIYISEDGVTAHQHKRKEGGTFSSSNTTTTGGTADTIISLLKNIDQKLDVLVKEQDRENNLLDSR